MLLDTPDASFKAPPNQKRQKNVTCRALTRDASYFGGEDFDFLIDGSVAESCVRAGATFSGSPSPFGNLSLSSSSIVVLGREVSEDESQSTVRKAKGRFSGGHRA